MPSATSTCSPRAKWAGVLLPIAFIWGFEIVRWWMVEPSVPADSAHVFAALVMSGAAVLFGLGLFAILDRAQRRLIESNQDLAATHAVASALQGGDGSRDDPRDSPSTRVLEHTGALAGEIRVAGPGRPAPRRAPSVRRLGAGLQWVEAILDDRPPTLAGVAMPCGPTSPVSTPRSIDVPLRSPAGLVGSMRS